MLVISLLNCNVTITKYVVFVKQGLSAKSKRIENIVAYIQAGQVKCCIHMFFFDYQSKWMLFPHTHSCHVRICAISLITFYDIYYYYNYYYNVIRDSDESSQTLTIYIGRCRSGTSNSFPLVSSYPRTWGKQQVLSFFVNVCRRVFLMPPLSLSHNDNEPKGFLEMDGCMDGWVHARSRSYFWHNLVECYYICCTCFH